MIRLKTKYLTSLITFACITYQAQAQQEFQVIFEDESMPASEVTFTENDAMRSRLIEKAHEFIGVGYHYGQSNENGFDCSGYVSYVFASVGFTLPHSSYEQYKKSRHLNARQAEPGDLVFFKTGGTAVSHVGIYLGDNLFIHAPSSGKKVSINTLEEVYYKKHLVGFGSVF